MDNSSFKFEPFKIHSVAEIKTTTRSERETILKAAGNNLFKVPAEDVMVDFLTDSGTGSMSKEQWAGIQLGDESYAGAKSWFNFKTAVTELFPFKHILPTHQGRAAEKILFSVIGDETKFIPSNTHFDTTRANIENTGCKAVDFVTPAANNPEEYHPFKGNMDVEALEDFILEVGAENIPVVMTTITNNTGGGQPVSMKNMKEVSAVCKKYGLPFFLDSCRFAENAWFIRQKEEGYADVDIKDIVLEFAGLADGMTMSAKKDPMGNIGGWLAMNDDEWAEKCNNIQILTEGFTTYGGLAGRDLEAIAVGVRACIKHEYLEHRIESTTYLGQSLAEAGVPIVQGQFGSAVYIDARKVLPHIPPLSYPGQALALALYKEGGVRSCEIGTAMFGRQPDGTEKAARQDLVRLAIPRRVYTKSHMDYVVSVCKSVMEKAPLVRGCFITKQPKALRHFSADFEEEDILRSKDQQIIAPEEEMAGLWSKVSDIVKPLSAM